MRMTPPKTFSDRIAELLIHIGRSSRTEDAQSDLTAAQWTCLRFLARSNRSTRTPSGFASFHATTRGTASQIIKSLETRGMIIRRRSPDDGRSVFFDLTNDGTAALARDPLGDLIGVIDDLDARTRASFLSMLTGLSSSLAERRGDRAFGTCGDCIHFTPTHCGGHCKCIPADIPADEIDRLCASYKSQDIAREAAHGRA